MPERFHPPKRSWPKKFADAFGGIWAGMRGQSSFAVHICLAVLVVVAGIVLRVTLSEWCILALCITLVLTAEMFNSALESLAKEVEEKENENIARALDIGSGAVLVSAIGAAITGMTVFVFRIGVMLQIW